MGCHERWKPCLDNDCCLSAADACYKRSGRQFKQCRPLARNGSCVSNADWLCPHLQEAPHLPANAYPSGVLAAKTPSGSQHTSVLRTRAPVIDGVGQEAGQNNRNDSPWQISWSRLSEATQSLASKRMVFWLVVLLAVLVVVCWTFVICAWLLVRRRFEGSINPKLEARGIGRARVRHRRLTTGDGLEQVHDDSDDGIGDGPHRDGEMEIGAAGGNAPGPLYATAASQEDDCCPSHPVTESTMRRASNQAPIASTSIQGKPVGTGMADEEQLMQRVAELLQDAHRC